MNEAFIYDAIRTPRGKGKKDGSLHEVKPVNLLAGVLTELQRRNGLDTAAVDDVVMGVVSPVGEQGSEAESFSSVGVDTVPVAVDGDRADIRTNCAADARDER